MALDWNLLIGTIIGAVVSLAVVLFPFYREYRKDRITERLEAEKKEESITDATYQAAITMIHELQEENSRLRLKLQERNSAQ